MAGKSMVRSNSIKDKFIIKSRFIGLLMLFGNRVILCMQITHSQNRSGCLKA